IKREIKNKEREFGRTSRYDPKIDDIRDILDELRKELKSLTINQVDEVITIDSETAERDPDMVKKLQDKLGDEDMIQITENYIKNLINENESPKITKDKLLKSLNLK
ncbi:hypothetical protein COB55_05620, partial [Candidatus Wolfebacteria bacterium]